MSSISFKDVKLLSLVMMPKRADLPVCGFH